MAQRGMSIKCSKCGHEVTPPGYLYQLLEKGRGVLTDEDYMEISRKVIDVYNRYAIKKPPSESGGDVPKCGEWSP